MDNSNRLATALVVLFALGIVVGVARAGDKITICHHGTNTLSVSVSSWEDGHEPHGDTLGACGSEPEPLPPTWTPVPEQVPTNTPQLPPNTPNAPVETPEPVNTPVSSSTAVFSTPEPVFEAEPLFSVQETVDSCDLGCCALDPSEIALNEAKTALLEALTVQIEAGNVPDVQVMVN